LNDGRLLVVEYKGDMLATNDDSREKNAAGEYWSNKNAGKCLFVMAVAEDSNGRNVFQQIEHVIKVL
jgi:type III restriction enzyme